MASIDISSAVNRAFVDDSTGKGGWLNQGKDDLRGMTPGKMKVGRIEFDVLDPATNGGKAVLILGHEAPFAKEAGFAVDGFFKRICLLHACDLREESMAGSIDFLYEDGEKVEIAIELRVHLGGEWWCPPIFADRAVPLTIDNKGALNARPSLYAASIQNPRPEARIKRIELHAGRGDGNNADRPGKARWMVFSIVASECQEEPFEVGGGLEIDVGTKEAGIIRALHGTNIAASIRADFKATDISDDLQALKIPLTRLHDCPLVDNGMRLVDIPMVFPFFHLDEKDPRNYFFAQTDDYIANCLAHGGKIMYRLGVSIEHSKRKYFTAPPSDYEKWAEICCQIVAHYNEGWADGFHHGIEYWEIWNEADLGPQMWSGSWSDYVRLYVVASKRLKARFPNIKVGGPSMTCLRDKAKLRELLSACREEGAPLDFLSWHSYASHPDSFSKQPAEAKALLDEAGFGGSELMLTEWHYSAGSWDKARTDRRYREKHAKEMSGIDGAAFNCAVLSIFQDTPLTMSNYYIGTAFSYWGLFDPMSCLPNKNYFSLKAFAAMTECVARLP